METRSLSPKHADAAQVPIIGMGTSRTLDTDDLTLAGAVVSAALDADSTLFDSSPMYGKAEHALGAALEGRRSEALVATKVWTDDDEVAERQIAASLSFYGGHIELLQIRVVLASARTCSQFVSSPESRSSIGRARAAISRLPGSVDNA